MHQQKLIPWAVLAAPSPDGTQGEGQGLCASPGVCRARAVVCICFCLYVHTCERGHTYACMRANVSVPGRLYMYMQM